MNHELPKGWVETTLGKVVAYASTNKIEPENIEDHVWVLELEDIEKSSSRLLDKVYFSDRQSKSTKNSFNKGDVLYGKLRPYLDKVIIADEDGVCTTEIIPLQPSEFLDNRFLFYNLKRREFLDYVEDASHGVNMPRLGTKQGKEAPFVLAPLSEQIRIADKLDRVLARVNAAQSRLDKIPALIKRFRQSVLAAATSGELTREWRENNVSAPMVDYEQVPFDDLLTELRNGLSPKPNENGKGIPILRISSVRSGAVDQSDIRYLEVEEKIRDLYKLKEGDLLFTRYNGSLEFVGGCGLLKELNHEYLLYPDKLIRARLCDKALPEYINIYFSSPKARNSMLESVKTTSGQKGISGKDIKSQLVGIPLLDEQYEIVRRVESLFSLADTVEKQYRDARARTDRLTQAILAKAFRGELVPQNPDDEPAEVLLKRIRQQRAEQATVSNKRNTKTNAAPKKSSDKSKRLHSKDNKVKPAITSGDDLLNLLTELGGEADASALWKKSGLSIDNFYALLKTNDKIEDHNPSSDPAQRKLRVRQ